MKSNDTRTSVANTVRKKILEMSYAAKVGHVGSAFSIVEILILIYFHILTITKTNKKIVIQDSFILSKGHAANALYAVMHARGILSSLELATYCENNSLLEEHPNFTLAGIEVSTGSLGHGLSIGVGLALAARVQKKKKKIIVLISDAECDEGSTWEAALSAAHHNLNSLFVFLDYNKVQAMGKVSDVLGLEPLKQKWQSFGWEVYDVDGHSLTKLKNIWDTKNTTFKRPTLFLCHTIRGKGVSFMEHKTAWHYKNPDEQEYKKAVKELAQ